MENIVSYKDLDLALDLLLSKHSGNTMPSYDKFREDMGLVYYEKDIDILINKLKDDKLIKYIQRQTKGEDSILFVTFEGMLKLQDGGYMGKLNKEKWKKRRDIVTTWAIAIGTFLAAVFSILSYFNIR